MLAKVYSAAVIGVNAYEVEVEVNTAGGKPVMVVVGLPDAAVKESRDRVITAVANSGYRWPNGRTTINLAPADVANYHAKHEATSHRAKIPRIVRTITATTTLRANDLAGPAYRPLLQASGAWNPKKPPSPDCCPCALRPNPGNCSLPG